MNKYQISILFIVVFALIGAKGEYEDAENDFENLRPVIGVYTQPSSFSQYPASKYQYIAASYIKYLEMAGARAIPIFYDTDHATLDDQFSKINGILFPGGGADLSKGSIFSSNAEYLLNKAITANRNGDYFPIWGTCLGFQLLHVIVSEYAPDVLTHVGDIDHTHEIAIYDAGKIYSGMTSDIFNAITNYGVYYYNHNWGVIDDTYKKYPALSNFFKITAHSTYYTPTEGIKFIASVESKNYPIYGTQYHPEKLFEWKINSNHTELAVLAQQYMANFFVAEAKKNKHTFNSETEIYEKIIWNYPCIIPEASSSFNQAYILPNSKNNFESKIDVNWTRDA